MKLPLLLSVCLVALLGCPVGSISQTPNRFDIVLEGPWIIYQDNTAFAGYPVLVAIAPNVGMDKPDAMSFHYVEMNTGDGYYFDKTGIYCVKFDKTCAPSWPGSFTSDGYPNTAGPLSLNFMHASNPANKNWDWVSASTNSTAIILPMPKSYSNGAVWSMRFSKIFDHQGNGYAPAGGESHSISLQLHYELDSQVSNFDLMKCDPSKPTISYCNKAASFGTHTTLPNYGTLRILMKAPEQADACDTHVRGTYPKVVQLLGGSGNVDRAVIEPAEDIDSQGKAVFEDQSNHDCFDKEDPQRPGWTMPPQNGEMISMQGDINTAANRLDSIVELIDGSQILPPDQKNALLLPQLREASKDLDEDRNFPRISELTLIETLARLSARKAETFESELELQLQNDRSTKGRGQELSKSKLGKEHENIRKLIFLYELIEDSDERVANAIPVKGAKDCLAAIVQAIY